MKHLIFLPVVIFVQGLVLNSHAWAQLDPSKPDTRQLLSTARQALERNAAELQSVTAQGRIRHLQFDRDVEAPVVALDADLLLLYDAPKFRLHLQYRAPWENFGGHSSQLPLEPNEADQHKLEQQTLLFDGQTVLTVERKRDGSSRGDIYFDFHKQNMLRLAGFPFEDPVMLWNEPLRLDRADLSASETKPLSGGGFLGVLTKDTYRLKYYFLGAFEFDLRRVSSYRLGEDIPFRDWHLNWGQSQGVHYVERLVRRINEATTADDAFQRSVRSHEQVELEYKTFDVAAAIGPEAFELSALALPESLPIYDHRVNVNGKPKVLHCRDGKLVDAQSR